MPLRLHFFDPVLTISSSRFENAKSLNFRGKRTDGLVDVIQAEIENGTRFSSMNLASGLTTSLNRFIRASRNSISIFVMGKHRAKSFDAMS